MTPSAEDYREVVQRGAALLDAKVPDWRERVDVAHLQMESCSECVLGQVFGDYDRGLNWLAKSHPLATFLHGFAIDIAVADQSYEEWDALRDAWVKELQR